MRSRTWLAAFLFSAACATAGDPQIDPELTDAASQADAVRAPDAPLAPDAPPPPPDAGLPDAAQPAAPRIVNVEWTWLGCDGSTDGQRIVLAAAVEDADTPPDLLGYDGSVAGCGPLATNPAEILCGLADPAPVPPVVDGWVTMTVSDPEGGTDEVAFVATRCTSGTFSD